MNTSPTHVAIIMDGNGRWGKERGFTRSKGHYAGAQAMEKIIDASIELDIKIVTLFAFSSENWSRPQDEVNYLMQLPVRFFKKKLPEFMKRNIRVLISGNQEALPEPTKKVFRKTVEATKNNNGIIVNFAFNYGGRDDILQAVHQVIEGVRNKKIALDNVNEQMIQQFLYTKELPDPDIVIRTGGEKRVSNFLLWQCSKSQFYFSDVYFPDFTKELLQQAIQVPGTPRILSNRLTR
ncbi:polyprenyl diphosphate synthase [Oceanobacillus saliphilus]|uniref:polyprenyl diphosphate synthase n=1 Tax=Oceanobacillus saliphilus TaxID=2925834 RepID=UPI00201D2D0D|nr:polyprenyl diphosphate synthase [Oceanobacillus saliphilus]